MSIGDAEIKTQERVIRFFKDPEILGYRKGYRQSALLRKDVRNP